MVQKNVYNCFMYLQISLKKYMGLGTIRAKLKLSVKGIGRLHKEINRVCFRTGSAVKKDRVAVS
ncbi:hypothetical protein GCM10028791_34750 [Echinicola sediminis]